MFYVYVLQKNNKPYIGFTSDIKRRIYEHRTEDKKCKLIYCEVYTNKKLACNREQKLKQYGSAWKGLKKRIDL